MSAVAEVHAEYGVPGLKHGEINGDIRLASGMGLHIYMVAAKKLLRSVARKILNDININASAIVPFPRISLGILIGQMSSHSIHYRRRNKIFRRDQLNIVSLPFELILHSGDKLRVFLGNS